MSERVLSDEKHSGIAMRVGSEVKVEVTCRFVLGRRRQIRDAIGGTATQDGVLQEVWLTQVSYWDGIVGGPFVVDFGHGRTMRTRTSFAEEVYLPRQLEIAEWSNALRAMVHFPS